ncbi:hypothetical protein HOG21_06710 [bacterium]|nr:hypothetical protein [bacterium]
MKKIIIFIIVSIFTITTPIYANNEINPIATKWFNNFSAKIEKKFNTDKSIVYFEKFSEKIDLLLKKKKFTKDQISLINDIKRLSDTKTLRLKSDKANKDKVSNFFKEKALKEKQEKEKLQNEIAEKKSLALNDRAFKKELAIIEAKNKEIFIKNPELK